MKDWQRGEDNRQHTTCQPELNASNNHVNINGEQKNSNPELPDPENLEPELYFEIAESSLHEKGIKNKDDMYNYVVQASSREDAEEE